MGLRIRCGNCGQKYEIEAVTNSFDLHCAQCGAILTVPGLTSDAVAAVVPPESSESEPVAVSEPVPEAPKIKLALRLNRTESAPAAPLPEFDPVPEVEPVSGGERCPKHPDEPVTGNCVRCDMPLCRKCAEAFGCYCSAVCLRAATTADDEAEHREYMREGEKVEKFFALLKLSWRVALVLVLLWGGWLVWKWFLDPAGKLAWKWPHTFEMSRYLVLQADAEKFTLVCNDTVFSLDPGSGKVLATTVNAELAKMAVGQGKVLPEAALFFGEHGVVAIDREGRTKWRSEFKENVSGFQSGGGDAFLVWTAREDRSKPLKGEYDTYPVITTLHAVTMNGGGVLWSKEQSKGGFFHHYAVGKKYFARTEIVFEKGQERSGMLLRVSEIASGKDKWQVRLKKNISWGPQLFRGMVLFRADDTMHALQAEDGRKLWSLKVPGQMPWNAGAELTEVVYFISERHELTAVDLVKGKSLWTASLPPGAGMPVVADGKLYFNCTEEKAIAENVDVKLPPAYEQLRKEDPVMNEFFKKKGKNVKYVHVIVCLDAADGKMLWRHDKVYGNLVVGNGRVLMVWDSAQTTVLSMLGSSSGDTVIRQLSASSGAQLYQKGDPIGCSPPYYICGRKLVAMIYDRDASRATIGFMKPGASSQRFIGVAGFNLK